MNDKLKKMCNICKIHKLFSEFHKSKVGKYKVQGHCKKCSLNARRNWVKHNPERSRELDRNRYKRNRLKRLNAVKQYYSIHKELIIEQKRQYRLKNKKKIRQIRRKHYLENKEEISKKGKEYRNRPEVKLRVKNRTLIKTYGISLEQYNKMYSNQNGKCGICKKKYKKLSIDHCHKAGKVRGLLCDRCNLGLGLFKENIKFLNSAVKYVTTHK